MFLQLRLWLQRKDWSSLLSSVIIASFWSVTARAKTLLGDPSSRRSVIGGLCFDITELGKEFEEFRVEWVCRGANSVAHLCATRVSALERSFFWVDSVPEWLLEHAAKDCTPVSD